MTCWGMQVVNAVVTLGPFSVTHPAITSTAALTFAMTQWVMARWDESRMDMNLPMSLRRGTHEWARTHWNESYGRVVTYMYKSWKSFELRMYFLAPPFLPSYPPFPPPFPSPPFLLFSPTRLSQWRKQLLRMFGPKLIRINELIKTAWSAVAKNRAECICTYVCLRV